MVMVDLGVEGVEAKGTEEAVVARVGLVEERSISRPKLLTYWVIYPHLQPKMVQSTALGWVFSLHLPK